MDALGLPFSAMIGLRRSDRPAAGSLFLDDSPDLRNHLGTIHAAVQFALAESCSGDFLQGRFAELAPGYVGVVRRAEVVYRAPARGRIRAEASVDEPRLRDFEERLRSRGRAFINVGVTIKDAAGTTTLSADIEWFAQKAP
jgi:acyl-coenzyme A thioesterase PaaI-like protein